MRPRSVGAGRRLVLVVAALTASLLAAEPTPTPTGPSPTPTPTGGPGLSEAIATCETTSDRVSQLVRCDVDRVPPGTPVRMAAVTDPGGDPPRTRWAGAATAGDGGSVTVEAVVACDVTGTATVTVAAETDTGSYEHEEGVALPGSCRAAWQLTTAEWTRVVATVLVGGTLLLVLAARRRERRRHRRPHHPGPRFRLTGRRRRPARRRPAARGRGRPRRSPTRRR